MATSGAVLSASATATRRHSLRCCLVQPPLRLASADQGINHSFQTVAVVMTPLMEIPMLRQDYILRIIRQAVAAIARMLGAIKRGDYQEARDCAEAAYCLLGVPPELAVRMDSASLAGLFKQSENVRMLSQLSWQEGQLFRACGDPLNGLDRQRRAIELLLEVQKRDPLPEDSSTLQEMFRHVPASCLDDRYLGSAFQPK